MTRRKTTQRREDDFLAELGLWRNDPEHTAEIKQLAHEGNPHAQYALGLMYAEGRGIEQDEVKAYYWLSLAIEQGDHDAITLRQIVQQSMSLEQISCAEQRVAEGGLLHIGGEL